MEPSEIKWVIELFPLAGSHIHQLYYKDEKRAREDFAAITNCYTQTMVLTDDRGINILIIPSNYTVTFVPGEIIVKQVPARGQGPVLVNPTTH